MRSHKYSWGDWILLALWIAGALWFGFSDTPWPTRSYLLFLLWMVTLEVIHAIWAWHRATEKRKREHEQAEAERLRDR
jgi:signal transduction histidine kinase